MSDHTPYKITIESFQYKEEFYNLALSPELYPDDSGLDFTGGYTGLLLHPRKGTIRIDLSPDGNGSWDIEPKGIDPNVIDEIDKIILKIKSGTSNQY